MQFDTPEAVSVLTQKQLLQNAPRSTPEALMGLPGVWVQKTNHGGGSPFIRGLTGQQTLILIDGIRLNNATFRSGPNQYFNTIDPQSIAQIEVLRGSGSVQYGSDALGGVVHVLTKKS
jgi:iron complex outermembrane receptor protein/hemoglobin/transferrin/lactoferrin receptor protein